ncbi:gamma-glutamylcyclotransferase [Rhizobium sp. SSA_523]|uniref:gamma-glutamylcyclotransferase n=1 Tax=Rhizobium sp. SSA_523 TaxID=2952477 RepID=UPI002090A58C|nr:gamma-glutamylcyclotransferase [Rhizobium sp. SSA_523]MCO5734197.1 gamma-glutamylcyclotransferase [Rhizobium sp. SSA_523]WKC21522.1 gamma-glutamylcyclotransferase [Rhizobium sp. SSA_523]
MSQIPHGKKRPLPAMTLTAELVEKTLKIVEDEGPEPKWTPISDRQLDDLVDRVEREAAGEEIWVFAYGSLMWNPGFAVEDREDATAFGWHRAFALRIERFRANSQAPGVMLALRPGGSCTGLILKLPARTRRQDLRTLLAREIRYAEVSEMVRWVRVRTPGGERRALTFWASKRQSVLTEKIPLDAAAALIAQACGPAGSCAEYLHRTVQDLAERNIVDRNLWLLQDMVAARLRDLPVRPASSRRP